MNDFIPCAGTLTLIFMFLAFILVMRYINYKETLKLAEKGLVKPANANGNGKGALIWGIIITAIGLALMIGLLPLGAMLSTDVPFGFGPWMLAGLLPTFFGLALVLIYVLTRQPQPKDEASNQPEKTENKSVD
jgi:preprotein translocase subunit SecG